LPSLAQVVAPPRFIELPDTVGNQPDQRVQHLAALFRAGPSRVTPVAPVAETSAISHMICTRSPMRMLSTGICRMALPRSHRSGRTAMVIEVSPSPPWPSPFHSAKKPSPSRLPITDHQAGRKANTTASGSLEHGTVDSEIPSRLRRCSRPRRSHPVLNANAQPLAENAS